jgi:hypothetical protein
MIGNIKLCHIQIVLEVKITALLGMKFIMALLEFYVTHSQSYCEISSSHGSEYDVQNFLLGCTAV